MKKLFGIATMLLASSAAMATSLVEVPGKGIAYQKLLENFDGSTTIVMPYVFFNTKYRPIGNFAEHADIPEDAANACALFGRGASVSHTHNTASISNGAMVISLDESGRIKEVFAQNGTPVHYLTSVTCR